MNRREIIAVLTLPFVARGARAQQPRKVYRLAIISEGVPVTAMHESTKTFLQYRALFAELRALGYVEDVNLTVDRRSAEGKADRYLELAREVVALQPDVIFTISSQLNRMKEATTKIPIVTVTGDPVANGVAASLARPGGNVTGLTSEPGPNFFGKYLEILQSIRPGVSKVAFLASRAIWETRQEVAALRATALNLGIVILGPPVESPVDEAELQRVFAAFREAGAEALFISNDAMNTVHLRSIVELANTSRLPAVYAQKSATGAGGLVSYGIDIDESFRMAARYVDRVFRGANPAEMPFYLPTKLLFAVNLKTAKAIGITIPPSLLARADEVIE